MKDNRHLPNVMRHLLHNPDLAKDPMYREQIQQAINHDESATTLMAAGREQDQANLNILRLALDDIACDYEHMKRKDMIEKAQHALCKIGAWRKVVKGEFAREGKVWKVKGYEDSTPNQT